MCSRKSSARRSCTRRKRSSSQPARLAESGSAGRLKTMPAIAGEPPGGDVSAAARTALRPLFFRRRFCVAAFARLIAMELLASGRLIASHSVGTAGGALWMNAPPRIGRLATHGTDGADWLSRFRLRNAHACLAFVTVVPGSAVDPTRREEPSLRCQSLLRTSDAKNGQPGPRAIAPPFRRIAPVTEFGARATRGRRQECLGSCHHRRMAGQEQSCARLLKPRPRGSESRSAPCGSRAAAVL
jgi:hypothetical protein